MNPVPFCKYAIINQAIENRDMKPKRKPTEQLLLNEIQLLLAEKRTYLALLRTGLTVFTVPLTVVAFLVATSEYHKLFQNFWIGFVTVGVLLGMALIGLSIFYRAEHKIKAINKMIEMIEKEDKRIAEIII